MSGIYEIVDIPGGTGVLKEILQKGVGEERPFEGCKVKCHYNGKSNAGIQIDSRSTIINKPGEFELGRNIVDYFVASMKKGEKARFTVTTSDIVYGSSPNLKDVPDDLKHIAEMELLSWKPQDLSPNLDGSITRQILTKNSDASKSPIPGALVKAHIIGKYKGRLFDERDVEFQLFNENINDKVIFGIHRALLHFGLNETSRLVISYEHAFGAPGNLKIPPFATVEYTVKLNEFENDYESLVQANIFKLSGTGMYEQKQYSVAWLLYNHSLLFLDDCSGIESQKIKVALYLNIALCHQKLEDHFNAKIACSKALEIEPNNIKALYRHGTSCLKTGETNTALMDFQKVKDIDPNNKAALSQIAACNKIIQGNDKMMYANMFKSARADIKKEENGTEVLSTFGKLTIKADAQQEVK